MKKNDVFFSKIRIEEVGNKVMKTTYINFVAGPSCGKSLMSALTYATLKSMHKSTEIVQEYAKMLIYKEEFETLNCQWVVSYEQYKMLKALNGKVNYVCTDSPLVIGLFYNRNHPGNVCDRKVTENMILSKINEFEANIYIYLERNDEFPFEAEGRIHGEQESKRIDMQLKDLLEELGLEYLSVKSSMDSIPAIIEYVMSKTKPKN